MAASLALEPVLLRAGKARIVGVHDRARASCARGARGARAAGDRARLLARSFAERGRSGAPHPARHREDEDEERVGAPRRRARRRAHMSGRTPDFDELVGSDLEPAERERMHRVHELLLAAGPPPEFEAEPPLPAVAPSVRRLHPARRRRFALVALAAAFLVAVFGAGYFAGNRGPGAARVVALAGTARASGATASLKVFSVDAAGNWPMELDVKGLAASKSGQPYELWLTKGGRLAALCGSFRARPDGTAHVPMNVPYRL